MNKVIVLVLLSAAVVVAGEKFTQLKVVSASSRLECAVGVWWGIVNNAPVAVWFHGGMSSGNCEKGLVAGRDFSEMFPGFTTVSVSACKNNHWVTRTAVEWVDAALDSVAARRGVPVDSVHLVGISDGGLGVVAYTSWGGRGQRSRLLMSTYGPALGHAEDVALQLKSRRGRWLFLQGGSDRLYPARETTTWNGLFCQNVGSECDMRFDPEGEHDWSYWQNKRKNWILEFFSEIPLTKTR